MINNFNSIFNVNNEIKSVDLFVNGLGFIDMELDDFEYFINYITDIGCTYRFIVTHNGNTLTKDGVPFDSILFTIDDNKLLLEQSEDLLPKGSEENDALIKDLSYFIGTADNRPSEDGVKEMLKLARISLADSFMFLHLQSSLEKMIRESDYFKNIYLDKGITYEDILKDESLRFNLDNISLAYFKSSV
jgi:hypothetical protein